MAILDSGCQTLMLKLYGVKDPDFESQADIVQFQKEIGFGDVPFSGLKATAWFGKQKLSVPDVFVFSADGKYIPYKDSLKPNCNGPAEVFLSELDPKREYQFSEDYSLNNFLELLEGPNCQPLNFKKMNEVDFYIFMNYASFLGKKIFKEKSIIWFDSLKQNKKIKYQLYMVNMDFKDCWTPEQKQLFESAD